MKKLFIGALLSVLPAMSLQAQASSQLQKTEIAIRPLQLGLSAEGGVLGTEVRLEVNGAKVVNKVIYITGKSAEAVVNETNKALSLAGESVRFSINTSKQMITISGEVAASLIDRTAYYGAKSFNKAGQLATSATTAVIYQTTNLTTASIAFARAGMLSTVAYAKRGLDSTVAGVKYVEVETLNTANDAAVVTYKALMSAVNFSKKGMVTLGNTALAMEKASVVYVNDAGLFVYDLSKNSIVQLGRWTNSGFELAKTATIMSIDAASSLTKTTFAGFRSLYNHLPRISVSIKW